MYMENNVGMIVIKGRKMRLKNVNKRAKDETKKCNYVFYKVATRYLFHLVSRFGLAVRR